MVTSDMWYIDEGFFVWIIPSTYQPHESKIWAYTTSFVHTYIYRVFSVFITCLIFYLSHDYVYLCSLYRFPCMFSDSDLLIYMYLLDFGFTVIFLILLVISCTCMPGPHHLIMYTCACYACHLALSYVLAGLLITLDSHVQILESRPCWSCCSWSECAAYPPMVIGV